MATSKCELCLELATTAEEWFPIGKLTCISGEGRNRKDLVHSATGGCEGCAILVQGMDLLVPERRLDANLSSSDQGDTLSESNGRIVGHPFEGDVQFYVSELNSAPLPAIISSHPYASSGLSSTEAFDGISRWLTECVEEHTLCSSISARALPARVIDVGSSESDNIRLYETHGETAQYICLSHCWGSLSFITTRTATIDAHKEGIAWSALTKTFQDAILVTRKLGVRWLWIDSLCIIQDDSEDWDRESAQMATIYENCYVALAATSAEDGNGGLFSTAHDREFVFSSKDGTQYPLHVRRLAYEHLKPIWGTNIEVYPLLYRGWCYQERLLAPRVLHFGAHDVIWECMTKTDCECGGIGKHENVKPALFQKLLSKNQSEISSAWREVVTGYTHLALSIPADKLPALSGLAKAFSAELNDTEYLAGLWRHSLPQDLLWYVDDRDPLSETISWRAPSWSWAAPCGTRRIRFHKASVDDVWHATMLSAVCTPTGLDPTGRVSSGSLRLKGHLVRASLHVPDASDHSRIPLRSYHLRTHLDLADEASAEAYWSHLFAPDRHSPAWKSATMPPPPIPVHCLKLVTDMTYDYVEPQYLGSSCYNHAVIYLVLRCVDEKEQIFERLGLGFQMDQWQGELTEIEVQELRERVLSSASSRNIFADVEHESVVTII